MQDKIIEELRNTSHDLYVALRRVTRSIEQEIESGMYAPGTTRFDIKDSNGRYILLDGLTALANSQSAIVAAEGRIGHD